MIRGRHQRRRGAESHHHADEAHHEPEPDPPVGAKPRRANQREQQRRETDIGGKLRRRAVHDGWKHEREHLRRRERRPDEPLERQPLAAHDEVSRLDQGNAFTDESRMPIVNIAAVAASGRHHRDRGSGIGIRGRSTMPTTAYSPAQHDVSRAAGCPARMQLPTANAPIAIHASRMIASHAIERRAQ